MLADKDRIFTNIYGMHDRSLAGARKRGHWDNTAEIIGRGRDKIIDVLIDRIERLFVGSVAERVVRTAPCPVPTAKPRAQEPDIRAAA